MVSVFSEESSVIRVKAIVMCQTMYKLVLMSFAASENFRVLYSRNLLAALGCLNILIVIGILYINPIGSR